MEPFVTHELALDLAKAAGARGDQAVHVRQGDAMSCTLRVTLRSGGEAADVGDMRVDLVGMNSLHEVIEQGMGQAGDGTWHVTLKSEWASRPGLCLVYVRVTDGGRVVGSTEAFALVVSAGADMPADEAPEYRRELDALMELLKESQRAASESAEAAKASAGAAKSDAGRAAEYASEAAAKRDEAGKSATAAEKSKGAASRSASAAKTAQSDAEAAKALADDSASKAGASAASAEEYAAKAADTVARVNGELTLMLGNPTDEDMWLYATGQADGVAGTPALDNASDEDMMGYIGREA